MTPTEQLATQLLDQNPEFARRSIDQIVNENDSPIAAIRERLQAASSFLDKQFLAGTNIRILISARALFIDRVLASIWNGYSWHNADNISLLAVGGYGRGELHPYSDIDLLILSESEFTEEFSENISLFVTRLWDLNLDIGQSSRTLSECVESAKSDITIATNLLETRTIAGNDRLRAGLSEIAYGDHIYTDRAFFLAKREEQKTRHEKFGDTEYNLEPNLKSSPGTLRDIQTIGWITKRHSGVTRAEERFRYQFLTKEEYQILSDGEEFLWRMRYGLQMLARRNENRLLFDYQRRLAPILGFDDTEQRLAVELMMQEYYRTVLVLAELTDVMLQYFDEAILRDYEEEEIKLNNRFVIKGRYIEAVNNHIFASAPYALLEIFLLIAQHPSIKGIRATTIRAIREHRHLVNDDFRADIANTSLFMDILRTPHALHRTLSAMKRYNVLGRYLPEFSKIIGQMQHDLFHIYTVDAHTIRVIRNLVNFHNPKYQEQFPLAARLVKRLPKQELAYIAGLYHDIAKGRGGDHSKLGAVDARQFCARHHLSERDTQLVEWLVANHLVMSMTAQRKDTQDPEVIHQFARDIPSQVHLDYLFVLTVADIAATNPKLWNTWRATLLRHLYLEALRAIRRGTDTPVDRDEWINATKLEARYILLQQRYSESEIDRCWSHLDNDYFLQDSTTEIAWQTAALIDHGDNPEPLILIREIGAAEKNTATQIMISLRSGPEAFAATTAVLEQLNLNIVDARISAFSGPFSLSSFIVLDEDNKPLANDKERREKVSQRLMEELDDPDDYPEIIQRRTPRQLRLFSFPTEVTFSNDTLNQRTVMEVITPDRPGLLAKIGLALFNHDICLVNAKIATLGERVEDIFFITDKNAAPISDPGICISLGESICQMLDETLIDKTIH
ncbi:MAG: [protein-PII] uridylyltransferase [Gammaproteobacteria bacterium]|nr:MAG: [protein-PII] uridylyltransferase [Gammaproteobacteria bacterium]